MNVTCRIFLLILICIVNSIPAFANSGAGYDITNKTKIYDNSNVKTVPTYPDDKEPIKSSYMYGDKKFPLVGVTTSGPIFLDKTSCKFEVVDNVGYLSCLVYYGGGGSDGNGNAAKHAPATIRFSTWKASNKRVIMFLSSVSNKTGKNDTDVIYKSDNGFLNGLFWYSAGCLDISKYLD